MELICVVFDARNVPTRGIVEPDGSAILYQEPERKYFLSGYYLILYIELKRWLVR